MLAELNMMTEFKAEGVMVKRPTLRSLFEGYEAEPDPGRRGRMLSDCIVSLLFMAHGIWFLNRISVSPQVPYNKNGTTSGKILNVALSSKIAAAFWNEDSLTALP